jgi:hypothetical protein
MATSELCYDDAVKSNAYAIMNSFDCYWKYHSYHIYSISLLIIIRIPWLQTAKNNNLPPHGHLVCACTILLCYFTKSFSLKVQHIFTQIHVYQQQSLFIFHVLRNYLPISVSQVDIIMEVCIKYDDDEDESVVACVWMGCTLIFWLDR